MKKLFRTLLIACLLVPVALTLVACGGAKKDVDDYNARMRGDGTTLQGVWAVGFDAQTYAEHAGNGFYDLDACFDRIGSAGSYRWVRFDLDDMKFYITLATSSYPQTKTIEGTFTYDEATGAFAGKAKGLGTYGGDIENFLTGTLNKTDKTVTVSIGEWWNVAYNQGGSSVANNVVLKHSTTIEGYPY